MPERGEVFFFLEKRGVIIGFLNKSQPRKKMPEKTQDRRFNGDRCPNPPVGPNRTPGQAFLSDPHRLFFFFFGVSYNQYGQGLFNNTYPTHVPELR